MFFRNMIPKDQFIKGQSCISKTAVNYLSMERFINENMINRVNEALNENLVCVKYRVSNNNNSSDASSFHRDLQIQNKENSLVDIYTCLSYLDPAIMEVIPKSHSNPIMDYTKIVPHYLNKLQLKLNPGDILMFHASLIHKGIFLYQFRK